MKYKFLTLSFIIGRRYVQQQLKHKKLIIILRNGAITSLSV